MTLPWGLTAILLSASLLAGTPAPVGLTARVGGKVPLDLPLLDEEGDSLALRQVAPGRPLVLTLVYYRCDHLCPQLLSALGEALGRSGAVPGRDFGALTVSFDPRDTPAAAARAKANALPSAGEGFPPWGWRFTTATPEGVALLATAVGFSYAPAGEEGFAHPATVILIAPDGTITRALPVRSYFSGSYQGISFLPTELAAALAEAREGRVIPSSGVATEICFPHEPPRQAAFYGLLRWLGAANLAAVLGVFATLSLAGRRREKKGKGDG